MRETEKDERDREGKERQRRMRETEKEKRDGEG